MNICPSCGKQYADTAITCAADKERLKRLTCVADEYLGHFLANLPFGFEAAADLGPHTRSTAGDTPLHIAATSGDLRAIDLLLNAGAEINAPGERGFTPLHYAVEQEKLEAVRLLLARGADIHRPDHFEQLPKDIAELVGNPEITSLLDENAS